jgi:hypothetical protein
VVPEIPATPAAHAAHATAGRRKAAGSPTLLRAALCALLAAALLPAAGCQSAPEYEAGSYEDVKEALAGQPAIVYPDISKYEASGAMRYLVKLYPADRRVKNGYEVYTEDGIPDPAGIGTAFMFAETACLSIEFYKDALNPCPPLEVSVTHRTVAMQLVEVDDTESVNGPNSSQRFPEGSRIGALECRFDLGGYRYIVNAQFLLDPDEQKDTTYDEKMAQAHDELFAIIDDILDKGGIPR